MRNWRIGLFVCACLSAVAPQAHAQKDDAKVVITLNGQSVRILGFVATGPQPDLDRLLAAAATTPFVAKQLPPPDGPEVMVLFQPGSDPKTAVDFYQRAASEEFSTLKIGTITYPVNP